MTTTLPPSIRQRRSARSGDDRSERDTASTSAVAHRPSETPSADDSRSVLVPRCCTLDGFATEADDQDGVDVARLDPLTRLSVRTENSLYRLTILDPWRSRILLQGGQFFRVPSEAVLGGSTFGGSVLKLRWIGRGMRMEIHGASERIITSAVRSVEIDDDSDLPGPF
jgi:hypothetical protein